MLLACIASPPLISTNRRRYFSGLSISHPITLAAKIALLIPIASAVKMNPHSPLENALRTLNRWKRSSTSILSVFSSDKWSCEIFGKIFSVDDLKISVIGNGSKFEFNLTDAIVEEQSPLDALQEIKALVMIETVSALSILLPGGESLFLFELRPPAGKVI